MPFETYDLPARREPEPIDIEHACQWAVARTGRLPWNRTDPRDLEMNRGLTMRPRKRPITSWAIAAACAGLTMRGRALPAMMTPGPDAHRIISAIMNLEDAAIAGIVIACARGKIRPDWMPGVVPRRQIKQIYGYRKNRKRRGRPILMAYWHPCSPAELQAARDTYTRWHKALASLVEQFPEGSLSEWTISGFAAPTTPWVGESSNSA